ncbi:unnamed protein product [Durusdinium trenchii]|uniref:Chitin-binding type-1 domain-containing protein n=1 Tax=Durusdinium trenchii TaxID=1381693 RepID=A0ABP0NI54_9DINO
MILFNESKGTYRRWRGDFRCGSRVPPLPDGEMVECPPGFDAPCCSALGWCGRSADHCKCEMCSDYRHKAKVTYAGIKLKRAKRECETIAADLGPFSSPEETGMCPNGCERFRVREDDHVFLQLPQLGLPMLCDRHTRRRRSGGHPDRLCLRGDCGNPLTKSDVRF